VDSKGFHRGLELFNLADFYDAHEVWEDVWRAAPTAEKKFLQGLIQIAVGLHHHSTGNCVGAKSLLARGARNLSAYSDNFGGIDLRTLLQAIADCHQALVEGHPLTRLPRIEYVNARIGFSGKAFPVSKTSMAKPHIPQRRAKKFEHVPLLDLERQYRTIGEEVLTEIRRVCASQQFILGTEVEKFESEIAAYTGADHAVGCASGTDALWLALLAVGVQPGDSVVTSAFSFFASASSIVRAAARPMFVDVDPGTLNVDPACLEAKLRSERPRKLAALLGVHLYGQCADMDALQKLGDEFHVPVVEDGAQSIGAAWRSNRAGSLGAAAAFSFYPTKNLGAYGDAGLVTTNKRDLATHMRRLRNHGSSRRYHHEELGWNSRLDSIQAAVLRVKLRHVEEWNAQRRQRAAMYEKLFVEAGLAPPSSGRSGSESAIKDDFPVSLPRKDSRAEHVFHQYVIRARRRDELREFLASRGVGTEIYYPIPLHLQTCFSYLGYRKGDFPESERAAEEVLAIPMFPELSEGEQRWVVKNFVEFYS
jgi:dTDP-4-amino-4,6-dideoxygalactose transaminase